MANGNLAEERTEAGAGMPSPSQRKLSSARPDEEVPQGEFWVLLRSVAIIIAVVVAVGWIIG